MIFQTQYLPSLSWIVTAMSNHDLVISNSEVFKKSDYRNRCNVASSNGISQLIIPLKKWKKEKTTIDSILISYDTDWQKNHWQSIQSYYGQASYFIYYKDDLQKIFESKFETLIDFNDALLNLIFKYLKHPFQISYTNQPSDQELNKEINFPVYYQTFSLKNGFIPNLSIIDLIFNLGPGSKSIIDQLSLQLKLPSLNPPTLS